MNTLNKKLAALILILTLFGQSCAFSGAFAIDAPKDDQMAKIEDAFSPTIQQKELTQPDSDESAQANEKKSFSLKFWKKKPKENEIIQSDERDFKDAKKYVEKRYQETKEAEKKAGKKSKKVKKQEVEQETPVEEVPVSDRQQPAEGDNTPGMILETTTGKEVSTVQGSVETNKIINVDDCVRIALENNPTILSMLTSKDIYQNKIAQAWSNYFPTISAGLSYSRNDMLLTNIAMPNQKYNMYNAPAVGFNQLIFDFGKTTTAVNIAKKTFEAADQNLQGNINDVIYQVKNAYYSLLFAMQQVEVYEDTVANYAIHQKQAQAYYDIGTKPKIDVITASYNLDNAKLGLIQAKHNVETAYAQLNNAMGVPEYTEYSIKEKLNSKKYDVIFNDMIKEAYEYRPALLAAKKKAEGSELIVRASKVAFLPDINAFGNYTRGGKKPDTDYGYQLGAQVAYSNTNILYLKKQVDESKLTYQKDRADYEVQRQTVYLEVKQAYIQFKNAQESIPVALSSMNRAKEQYDLASGRYKVGLGDAVELKDSENTYRNAQLNYYNALTQFNTSAANLERVVGTPIIPRSDML